MRRLFFIVAGVILLFGNGLAQDFRPADIVLSNGKVLKGDVRKFKRSGPVTKLYFRYPDSGKVVEIPIDSVKSLMSGGDKYITAYVKLDETGEDKDNLPTLEQISYTTGRVLLKVLVEGPKSLYTYQYKGKDLFYIRENDSIVLLEAPMYVEYDSLAPGSYSRVLDNPRMNYSQYVEVTRTVKMLPTFRYQLYSYLGDCPSLYYHIVNAKYNLYYLTGLFKSYYSVCSKTEPDFNSIVQKPQVDYGVKLGYTSQYLDFYSEKIAFNYLTQMNFPVSRSYYAGAYIQFRPWETGYRLALSFSPSFYELNTSSSGSWKNVDGANVDGFTSLSLQFADLMLGIKYSLLLKSVDFGFIGTLNYVIPFKYVSTVKLVIEDEGVEVYDGLFSQVDGKSLVREEFGFSAGLFLEYKRFGLEAHFTNTNGFLSPMWLGQKNMRFVVSTTVSLRKDKS